MNKREARKILALRISEVQRGVFVKPINITLLELGENYIEYARLHKRSWKRDVQMLANLQTFFGPCKLRDITPLRIEEYQHARLKQVTAPATSNWELALLKHMFLLRSGVGSIRAPTRCGLSNSYRKQPPLFNSQRGRGATTPGRRWTSSNNA